jgi:hypothetical protein
MIDIQSAGLIRAIRNAIDENECGGTTITPRKMLPR